MTNVFFVLCIVCFISGLAVGVAIGASLFQPVPPDPNNPDPDPGERKAA
jgi:hypothetical protein